MRSAWFIVLIVALLILIPLALLGTAAALAPYVLLVFALVTGTGPWYLSVAGIVLYTPLFRWWLRYQVRGLRKEINSEGEEKTIRQRLREAFAVVRGLRILYLAGTRTWTAFVERCGGTVFTVSVADGCKTIINPQPSSLHAIEEHVRELQATFRRVSGFDTASIREVTVALFTRLRDFSTLLTRVGLPRWNVAGLFSGRLRSAVCLVDEVLPGEWQAQRVITHELTHSLQDQYRPAFRSAWLQEGFAEYCSLAVLDEQYREAPETVVRRLIDSRCHFSFRDLLQQSYSDLDVGFADSADVDGLLLVSTFYVQSCTVVRHLIEATENGPERFAALLADLRRKRDVVASLQESYGLTLAEWERSWHCWIREAPERTPARFASAETIRRLEEVIRDKARPPGERSRYVRYHALFAGENALPFLRECEEEEPLRSAARFSRFLLGESIQLATTARADRPEPGAGRASLSKNRTGRG